MRRLLVFLLFAVSTFAQTQFGGNSSVGGGFPSTVADPMLFGAKANAKWLCDATFTNGSPTVTTPATDRPFLATDSFAVVWGSTALCGGQTQQTITNLTGATAVTATFNSAHQITLSVNSSANCTPTGGQGGCTLVWGPDDTAAVQSAFNLAMTNCVSMALPAGGIILSSVITSSTGVCPVTDSGDDPASSITVFGQGPYSTMLLFAPGTLFPNPMFSVTNIALHKMSLHDFGIASFTSAVAGQSGQVGFGSNAAGTVGGTFNSEYYHLWFTSFFPSAATSFSAFQVSGVLNAVTTFHDNLMLNAGFTELTVANSDVNLYSNWIQGSTNLLTLLNGTTRLKTWGNRFTLTGSQGCFIINTGATWDSWDDVCQATGSTLGAIRTVSTDVINFHNLTCVAAQTTGPCINNVAGATITIDGESSTVASNSGTANGITNAGTLILRNVALSSTGGVGLSNSGTVTVKDGNTFSNSIANTGTIQGQPGQGTWAGACTGVVTSVTTVGLYGLGQTTTTACTSTTIGSGQVMSKAGTVYALYCTATAGNQAADACTVVKNGASQTMLCSLNAVAACTDGAAAHVVTYVQGDILSIEATAGAASTLANVKGTLVTN